MRATSTGERLISVTILVLAGGALGFLSLVNPASSSLILPCPFRAITGCYCPGCGSMGALHQLVRGHLVAAFRPNPLMVLSLPVVAHHGVSQAKFAATGLPLRGFYMGSCWIRSLLCLILAYGVSRNIPLYPFDLLVP